MNILEVVLESFLLVIALTLDTFVACFAYGTNRIKIPLTSALILSGISTALLSFSLFLGFFIKPLLPTHLTHIFCFILLFLLGVVKLFDSSFKAYIRRKNGLLKSFSFKALSLSFILTVYADPEIADKDASRTLSHGEALSLALALSIDGLAVGFGAAISQINYSGVILTSMIVGFIAVVLGGMLGEKVRQKINLDLSWLSGVLLIILGILKLK